MAGRTLEIKAPDGKTYEITAPDGMPDEDAVSRFKTEWAQQSKAAAPIENFDGVEPEKAERFRRELADKPADRPWTSALPFGPGSTSSKYKQRLENSMLMGAEDEIKAGLTTAFVDAPKALLKGQVPNLSKDYSDNLRFQRARIAKLKEETSGAGGLVADVAGGFMLGPASAAVGAVKSAAAPVISGWREPAKQLAKAGAVWGGTQAFLDTDGSAKPDATMGDHFTERAKAVPLGAATGAGSALALGGLLAGGSKALQWRDRRRAARAERIQRNVDDAKEAGISDPLPVAMTDSNTAKATARGLGKTIVGGRIREGAAKNISQLERGIDTTLRDVNFGKDTGEVGTDIQRSLYRNLHEHSLNPDEVAKMTPEQLQDATGVGISERYKGKAPKVEPVQPREVEPPQRRVVTDEDVDRSIGAFERGETPRPRILSPDDVPAPEALVKGANDAKASGDAAEQWLGEFQPKLDQLDAQIETLAATIRRHTPPPKPPAPRSPEDLADPAFLDRVRARRMTEAAEISAQAKSLGYANANEMTASARRLHQEQQSLIQQRDAMARENAAALQNAQKAIGDRDAAEAALRRYQQENLQSAQAAENERVASEAEKAYQDALNTRRAETRSKLEQEAEAEHQRMLNDPGYYERARRAAQEEAYRETSRKQAEAEGRYEAELSSRKLQPTEFRTDLTKHSYPTTFKMAYEQAYGQAPGIQRNPLGGRGPSGVPRERPPQESASPLLDGDLPPQSGPSREDIEWAKQTIRATKRIETLSSWLVRNGGLRDAGGDVRNTAGSTRARPGLMSKKGMTLDDAALRAWELGFIPGKDRPDINRFLDALDDDLNRGRPVVREADRNAMEERQYAYQILEEAERYGSGGGGQPRQQPAKRGLDAQEATAPYELTTATEKLLNEFGLEARRSGLLRGYQDGVPFAPGRNGEANVGPIDPALMAHLRRTLGPEVAQRIQYLSESRGRNLAVMGLKGIRDVRTAVRRAVQDAKRESKITGKPLGVDDVMLSRLEQALSEDMHRFLRNAGPDGAAASERFGAVDRAYGEFQRNVAQPLSRIVGPKDGLKGSVSGAQVMDRIAKAVESGDNKTLDAMMRVLSEKGDPQSAVAGVLAHMSSGGGKLNMKSFIEMYGNLPNTSKQIIFRDPRTTPLRQELDRFHRVGMRLMPFLKTSQQPAGVDLARVGHIGTVAAMWFHFVPAVTFLGGAGGASRVLSSPRLLRWLTAMPKKVRGGPNTPEARRHLARLAAIASHDAEYGDALMEAGIETLMPTQH